MNEYLNKLFSKSNGLLGRHESGRWSARSIVSGVQRASGDTGIREGCVRAIVI
jgi:hypothetical protein